MPDPKPTLDYGRQEPRKRLKLTDTAILLFWSVLFSIPVGMTLAYLADHETVRGKVVLVVACIAVILVALKYGNRRF